MKKLFISTIFILGVMSLLLSGCGQSSKTKEKKGTTSDGKEASVEVEVFDAVKFKDQIVETIQNLPKTSEVADLINESGASYIVDLTIPPDDAEKLMTSTQLGLGLGLYAFDIEYANVYNRGDVVAQLGELEKQIITKLGLESELTSSENYVARIKANAEDKDSVDYLITEAMNFCHQQFTEGEHPGVYALAVIGGNVEAMYVLSQLALLAENNAELLAIVERQKERAKSVYTLLEIMSGDETVSPYFEKMGPVVKFFQDAGKIGEAELNEIAPQIESLRNSMIQ